jgi:hypothetical protein
VAFLATRAESAQASRPPESVTWREISLKLRENPSPAGNRCAAEGDQGQVPGHRCPARRPGGNRLRLRPKFAGSPQAGAFAVVLSALSLHDNRDNSIDSRSSAKVGFVPAENIVGRAAIVYFSIDHSAPFGLGWVRWSRLLTIVRYAPGGRDDCDPRDWFCKAPQPWYTERMKKRGSPLNRRHSAPKGPTLGREWGEKISAIEGIRLSAAARKREAEFDRLGMSAGERRKAIVRAYRKG